MNSTNNNSEKAIQIRKSKIRTLAAIQKDEFNKIVKNSFTTQGIQTEIQASYVEKIDNVNVVIGWQL